MKKRLIILLGVGISFSILPFLINVYGLWRLIILLIGILLITICTAIKFKNNIIVIILVNLILLSSTYGIDYLLCYKLNRLPIYAFSLESNDSFRTLNSFFYRVYDCNSNLVMDYGYKKSYICDEDLLDTIDVNSLLQDPRVSYKKYKNKFIKVSGKISKIVGSEVLELGKYTKTDDVLNGYVLFSDSEALVVNTTEVLSKYRIYDEITVIGRVDSTDGKKITLKDTLLIPSNIYDSFTYEVINNDSKLTNLVKDKNYYYYGINSINIKYDSNNIYELSYSLTDNRFSVLDIIGNSTYEVLKKDDEEIGKLYKLDKFNVVLCNNDNVIFASLKKNINYEVCSYVVDE